MPLHTTNDPAQRAAHIAERETENEWTNYYAQWLAVYRQAVVELQEAIEE